MTEEDEPGITVTRTLEEVDPTTIKSASAKRYITAALGAGFEVRAATTETRETRPPFKSGDKAGEARPDLVVTHLWLVARHPLARFSIHFKGTSFESARAWDAAGWPVTLYYDYSPSKNELKQVKDEPHWAWVERVRRIQENALRQDYEYNDDALLLVTWPRLVNTAGEFDEWLAELIPSFTVRKRKQKEEVDMLTAPLTMDEWRG